MFDVFGNIFQVTPQQRSKYRKSAANMFTAVQMGTRTFSEQCSAVHYEVHCTVQCTMKHTVQCTLQCSVQCTMKCTVQCTMKCTFEKAEAIWTK